MKDAEICELWRSTNPSWCQPHRQICSFMVISQHFVKSSQEIRFKISLLNGETFGIWICYIGTTSSQGTNALVEGSLSNIGANKKLVIYSNGPLYEWIHALSIVKYWHVHTYQCSTNMIIYMYMIYLRNKVNALLRSTALEYHQLMSSTNSTSIWHHQSSTFIASWSPSLTPKTQIRPPTPAKAKIAIAWNILDKSINPICPSCLHACMHAFASLYEHMQLHEFSLLPSLIPDCQPSSVHIGPRTLSPRWLLWVQRPSWMMPSPPRPPTTSQPMMMTEMTKPSPWCHNHNHNNNMMTNN